MRIEWLNKKNAAHIILFFNGWGMDRTAVAHLQTEEDVLMFSDYRSWDFDFPDLTTYSRKTVVAWSMGVWAAARTLSRHNIRPDVCIALNGTTRPVDDSFGIPVKLYTLTEKGMNERGREKFFLRMLEGTEERERFGFQKPVRKLEEVCEELTLIREESTGSFEEIHWDKSYVSEKDVIFPVENQLTWCRNQNIPVTFLSGGHYPFYRFDSWKKIIE